jgi:hypothetical protein
MPKYTTVGQKKGLNPYQRKIELCHLPMPFDLEHAIGISDSKGKCIMNGSR